VLLAFLTCGLVEHGYVVTQSVLSLHTSTPSRVTIMRRHHPLQGRTFEVLQGGPRELLVRGADGLVMRLPRAWTDADGPRESGIEAIFTVEAMRALLDLVDTLRRTLCS